MTHSIYDALKQLNTTRSISDLISFIQPMKTKTIEQTATFKATPHEVYETLLDSKKHAAFTGGKATILRKVGGTFTAYDGYIEGINLALVKDKSIVQAWRGSDWPENHFSIVVFELSKVSGGTKLTFTHIGVPENCVKDISVGWKEHYWQPMKKMLEKK